MRRAQARTGPTAPAQPSASDEYRADATPPKRTCERRRRHCPPPPPLTHTHTNKHTHHRSVHAAHLTPPKRRAGGPSLRRRGARGRRRGCAMTSRTRRHRPATQAARHAPRPPRSSAGGRPFRRWTVAEPPPRPLSRHARARAQRHTRTLPLPAPVRPRAGREVAGHHRGHEAPFSCAACGRRRSALPHTPTHPTRRGQTQHTPARAHAPVANAARADVWRALASACGRAAA